MKDLVIQQTDGKGRSFRATLVASVRLDARSYDVCRPLFMVVAGTENEVRPFVANLRTGRKAEAGRRKDERYEILKSAGYRCTWQRTPHGALATLFAPDLFALDPGMVDPAGVEFLLLPAKSWFRPSSVVLPDFVPEESAEDVRHLAPLFAAFLDRRTRCPLIPDERFYADVLAHALNEGLAHFPHRRNRESPWGESANFEAEGVDALGFGTPVYVRCSHEQLEAFLADRVLSFVNLEQKAA